METKRHRISPLGENQVIHITGISGTGAVCHTLIVCFNSLNLPSSTKKRYSEFSIPTNMEGNSFGAVKPLPPGPPSSWLFQSQATAGHPLDSFLHPLVQSSPALFPPHPIFPSIHTSICWLIVPSHTTLLDSSFSLPL